MLILSMIFIGIFCCLSIGIVFIIETRFGNKYFYYYAGAWLVSGLLSIIFLILGEK